MNQDGTEASVIQTCSSRICFKLQGMHSHLYLTQCFLSHIKLRFSYCPLFVVCCSENRCHLGVLDSLDVALPQKVKSADDFLKIVLLSRIFFLSPPSLFLSEINCAALAGLELTVETRLAWNSQRSTSFSLPSTEIKACVQHHHPTTIVNPNDLF